MRDPGIDEQAGAAPEAACDNRAFAQAADWVGEWAEALEASGRAVLALDAAGRVVSCGRRAAGLLGGRVQLCNCRLVIAEVDARLRLAELVAAALRDGPSLSGPPPPLVLRRTSGRHLHIDVLPVPRAGGAARVAALLLLRETDGDVASRAEILRRRFRLTPAELRLALTVGDGIGLGGAAEMLGIRMSTARAHLKSVFLKTETHRQAELVALLARLG